MEELELIFRQLDRIETERLKLEKLMDQLPEHSEVYDRLTITLDQLEDRFNTIFCNLSESEKSLYLES